MEQEDPVTGETQRRAEAIQGFVDRLQHLREDAGRPSFREMAKRSGAISHATLHDALQGARMPSWETTVEFAKACGRDPQDLRADWEHADAIVRSTCDDPTPDEAGATPGPETATSGPETAAARAAGTGPDLQAEPRTGDDDESAGTDARGAPVHLVLGAAAAVLVSAVVAAILLTRGPDEAEASAPPSDGSSSAAAHHVVPDAPSTTTSARGCPENAKVPPGTRTLVPGDASQFVRDVTIPDCATVERNEPVIKTWELKNTGTVAWEGRYLHRINADEGDPDCRAPDRVAIADTPPGDTVQVSVPVTTPDNATICFARWMQTDAEGAFTFPEQRPYFYTFKVR